MEVIVWVVGEYGVLSGRTPGDLMDALCGAVHTQPEGPAAEAHVLSVGIIGADNISLF